MTPSAALESHRTAVRGYFGAFPASFACTSAANTRDIPPPPGSRSSV
jgi:hypothetical protein